MKITLKLLPIVAIGLLAFAPRPYTIDLVRETILTSFLTQPSEFRKFEKSMPIEIDPNLPGQFKAQWAQQKIQYPKNPCGSSPAYLYYALYMSLDSTAYWNYAAFTYDKPVTDRFKTLFGQDIIKTRIKMAQKDYAGNTMEWRHYKAEGLQAAFDKLYQKPTTSFHGYGLQQIYNASVKEYARDIARVVAKVMTRKPEFENFAKQYMQDAMNKVDFEGQEFGNAVTGKLVGQSGNQCVTNGYDTRVVGVMLRRQCDGSLPTLLKCLKTVLKDYDPEFYNQVSSKF